MDIGAALKDIRKAKLLRQVVSAKSIGITQTYLSQIESNDKVPSLQVLNKISLYYNVPLPVILWKSIQIDDVIEAKQQAFTYVKPLIDQLINELI